MAYTYSIETRDTPQASPGHLELKGILDAIDIAPLVDRLKEYRPKAGRAGFGPAALLRAYLASFILNLPNTAALVRRLQDDGELRMICGLSKAPHRTTFSKFVSRLTRHRDLVESCLATMTDTLADMLPEFGRIVAIDSTVVRSHSNPNRRQISDFEASWTAKNSAQSKNGKEYYFGYKYHAVADASYGIPITGFLTTASRNDSPEMPSVMKQAADTHDWYAPKYVLADRGYDSEKNHRAIEKHGAVPIIAIRKTPGDKPREGIYAKNGAPTCIGMVEMEYVKSDPDKGHLYRCRREGCHLKDRKVGVRYCDTYVWENRQDRRRLFGQIRRDSQEWKNLYERRQAIERVFKSLKESRRLEAHCFRGQAKIALHAALSVLTFQATVLNRHEQGELDRLSWMVRKVG